MNIITVTAKGYIKKTNLDDYPIRRMGGKGVVNMKASERNGSVVGAICGVTPYIFVATKKGMGILFGTHHVKATGRNTQGVKAITLTGDDEIVSVSTI